MFDTITEILLLKDFHYNEDTNTYVRKTDGSTMLPATYNRLVQHMFDRLIDDYYTLKIEKRKQMIKERRHANYNTVDAN